MVKHLHTLYQIIRAHMVNTAHIPTARRAHMEIPRHTTTTTTHARMASTPHIKYHADMVTQAHIL